MKVFLLKHGESISDIENIYAGIADYPLTDNGRSTAYELGQKLGSVEIEVLYTSPYLRALETTGILARMLGLPMETVDDLRDRNSYGVLSGVNKAKAQEIFPSVLSTLSGEPGAYYSEELIPGAEPVIEFDSRVKNAVEPIVKDANGRRVVGIVTHENVIRSIYKNILGISGKVDFGVLAITSLNYIPMSTSIESQEGVQLQIE